MKGDVGWASSIEFAKYEANTSNIKSCRMGVGEYLCPVPLGASLNFFLPPLDFFLDFFLLLGSIPPRFSVRQNHARDAFRTFLFLILDLGRSSAAAERMKLERHTSLVKRISRKSFPIRSRRGERDHCFSAVIFLLPTLLSLIFRGSFSFSLFFFPPLFYGAIKPRGMEKQR